jgi:hypothetical protein
MFEKVAEAIKFKTRTRIRGGWALLHYRDGDDLSLPVYLEPSGKMSFRVEKSGAIDDIEIMLPLGDFISVEMPSGWGSVWDLREGYTMLVDVQGGRRTRY